ncbi:mobilization protein mobC [Pectobacterium versatile]|uniref:mobilization protein mobC n=1 Tax=Pectobacterium TaxID=122277 RepID=UPI000E22A7CD|nr:mobilization protein mobC [Pectobacterium aquaticum]MBA0182541.1 mobilization protein mobC [Pectobacterium versatile]RRO01938.1 mobilization protein mobC [Pectobacterium aquaticum]
MKSAPGMERTESKVTKHLEQRHLMLQWWANFLDANSNGLVKLFDSIRTVVRNRISVPFDAKNREMFLFRTIDELEQAPISHD